MTKTNKYLAVIVVAAFAVSLAYSFYFKNKPVVDSRRYDALAMNLINGKGYRLNTNLSPKYDQALVLVGPGYQFFLAGVFYIFGHSYKMVWFLQAIMNGLTALFAFLTAREIFEDSWNPIIGLFAAILIGFSPDLILANSMLLNETATIFLMSASIYLFFLYVNKQKNSILVALAFVLGLAMLVRSTILFLIPVFGFYFIIKKKWKPLTIFCLILLAVLTPWTLRNYRIYHHIVPFTLTDGVAFWWGNHHGVSGELDPFPDIQGVMDSNDVFTANRVAFKNGMNFILQNPVEFLKIIIFRVSIYFSFIRPTGWWPYPGGHSYAFNLVRYVTLALSALYSVFVFTFGIAGAYLIAKTKISAHYQRAKYLLAALIVIPLPVFATYVESRYRYPIYFVLAIFGGYFIYYLYQQRHYWKNRILLTVFSLLLINSVVDVLRNFSRIIGRVKN